MVARDVPSATQPMGRLAMPQVSSSGNHEDELLEHQGKRAEPSSSPRRFGEMANSRSDMVTYHMDQLLRTSKLATGHGASQFATLWENNAIWKGMRFGIKP